MTEEVRQALKKRVIGYIEFGDQNCHDLDDNDCRGWDGQDSEADVD